jgi:hypothetical protein
MNETHWDYMDKYDMGNEVFKASFRKDARAKLEKIEALIKENEEKWIRYTETLITGRDAEWQSAMLDLRDNAYDKAGTLEDGKARMVVDEFIGRVLIKMRVEQ